MTWGFFFKDDMNYLDLFSGIGGFHKGLEEAGFKFGWIGHSEIDKYAKSIYQGHFKESEDLGDVTNINVSDLPALDLVTFGFPCQDLSFAGKRGGLQASRSGLFYQATKIIKAKKPAYFIFENVKGLFSSNGGLDWLNVLREIADIGYDGQWQLLNTRWFLPQNRERVYFVGYLRGSCRQQIFPIGEEHRGPTEGAANTATVRAITGGGNSGGKHSGMTLFSDSGVGRKLQEINIMPPLRANTSAGYNDFILHAQRHPLKFIDRNQKNIEGDYAFTVDSMNTGGVKIEQHYSISCDCGCTFDGVFSDKCPKCGEIQGGQTNEIKIVQKERGFNKGGEKDICPTITTSSFEHNNHVDMSVSNCVTADGYLTKGTRKRDENGKAVLTSMHERRVRRFTPIECERLQGFEDDWTKYGKDGEIISDTQRYKTLGNAVSVPVVKAVGERLNEKR